MGRAMTLALIANGIDVIAVDRSAAALAETSLQLNGSSSGILTNLVVDLLQPGGWASALQQAMEKVPAIDILVNLAGIGQISIRADWLSNPVRFWELTEAQSRAFYELNTQVPFLLTRALAPAMIARGFGRIVNITTTLHAMLRGGNAPYGPSKAALEAMTAVMAADLDGTGVTANIIVPGGMTDTAFLPDDFDRKDMLPPTVVVPPLLWIVRDSVTAPTGRRFVASLWDHDLPPAQAAERTSAAIGWPDVLSKQHVARRIEVGS